MAEFKTRVIPRIADGTIRPVIHAVFPLAEVAAAHQTMEESRHFGKIVIKMASDAR